jgi:hypothetical protein
MQYRVTRNGKRNARNSGTKGVGRHEGTGHPSLGFGGFLIPKDTIEHERKYPEKIG